MKIEVTPTAAQQIELIAGLEVIETGFLFGTTFGKYIIVERLFPVNFNEKNIDEIYGKIISFREKQLLGVFFNNREPFLNDWFLEDVIIKIKPGDHQTEFYIFDSEKKLFLLNLSRGESKITASMEAS